jgi:hypothetical protein
LLVYGQNGGQGVDGTVCLARCALVEVPICFEAREYRVLELCSIILVPFDLFAQARCGRIPARPDSAGVIRCGERGGGQRRTFVVAQRSFGFDESIRVVRDGD